MEIQACGAYFGTEEEGEDSPADPQTQTPEGQSTSLFLNASS
jgi:hypothetical protein